MTSKTTCPSCETGYENLGQHWATSADCDIPPLTDRQRKLATGLTLGDGCIDRPSNGNPRLVVEMTTEAYLHHLDDVFRKFGLGVTHRADKGGFNEGHQDLYRWTTRAHPGLAEQAAWYGPDGRRIPDDLSLNPQVLHAWYVSDGCLADSRGTRYILLGVASAMHREQFFVDLFEDIGFTATVNGYNLQFPAAETEAFLDYIGDPVPGFGYKWGES
jgi:hypothetical protein